MPEPSTQSQWRGKKYDVRMMSKEDLLCLNEELRQALHDVTHNPKAKLDGITQYHVQTMRREIDLELLKRRRDEILLRQDASNAILLATLDARIEAAEMSLRQMILQHDHAVELQKKKHAVHAEANRSRGIWGLDLLRIFRSLVAIEIGEERTYDLYGKALALAKAEQASRDGEHDPIEPGSASRA